MIYLDFFSIAETSELTQFFDNDQFRVQWTFDDQKDKLTFHVKVKTTGWVGFGFANKVPNNMQNYDVIVGGFSNGNGYLNVSCLSRQYLQQEGMIYRDCF